MTIRLLCFPVLPGHKEKEEFAQTWPSTDVRFTAVYQSLYTCKEQTTHLPSVQGERRRKTTTYILISEDTRQPDCLIFCHECVTADDICFSAWWVAFTFMCTIRSKGFGHTHGDTELEVKPWSKMRGSRSGPISRPFTERCEKGAGCVSKG